MKNLTFLLLFLSLILASQVTAQEAKNKKSRQLKHEVGINATAFIKQILSFSDTSSASNNSSYLLTYKLMTKNAIGLRLGLGGKYNRRKEKLENAEDPSINTNNTLHWRIGVEWQRPISKRWKTSFGLDFIGNSSLSETVIDTGFDLVTFKDKSFALGGGPMVGLYFNINDKISLYTESAAYLTRRKNSNSQDFKNSPEFNQEGDPSIRYNLYIYVPRALYLVFNF